MGWIGYYYNFEIVMNFVQKDWSHFDFGIFDCSGSDTFDCFGFGTFHLVDFCLCLNSGFDFVFDFGIDFDKDYWDFLDN